MKIRLSQLKRFIREESEKVSGSLGSGAALDPASVKEVIKKFPKGIGKMGIDATRVDSFPVLGTGTRGTALDIGDDRVLKVTNDDRDSRESDTLGCLEPPFSGDDLVLLTVLTHHNRLEDTMFLD
jgi:hypothetical protein